MNKGKKHKEYKRSQHLDYEMGSKDYRKSAYLKCVYGISLNDYNRMFDEQNGCCDICKKHQTEIKKSLCVDHDHITGKTRGLLCHNCNNAIGKLFENIDIIENCKIYITKHLHISKINRILHSKQ